jgi:hypothetical protein
VKGPFQETRCRFNSIPLAIPIGIKEIPREAEASQNPAVLGGGSCPASARAVAVAHWYAANSPRMVPNIELPAQVKTNRGPINIPPNPSTPADAILPMRTVIQMGMMRPVRPTPTPLRLEYSPGLLLRKDPCLTPSVQTINSIKQTAGWKPSGGGSGCCIRIIPLLGNKRFTTRHQTAHAAKAAPQAEI